MKKCIVTLIFLATISVVSFAQLNGGLKAGINIATVGGSDADGASPRLGYHAGGYLRFDFNNRFSFQPELLIGSVGARQKEESYDDPDLGTIRVKGEAIVTYISVPAIFLFKLNDKLNVQAGPQVGFLVAAKAKYDIQSDFMDFSGSEDVKDQFKKLDFGINAGLGLDLNPVTISARYYLGLVDVPDEDVSLKNRAIMLSVGYKIKKN